jgi:hypothetical protein
LVSRPRRSPRARRARRAGAHPEGMTPAGRPAVGAQAGALVDPAGRGRALDQRRDQHTAQVGRDQGHVGAVPGGRGAHCHHFARSRSPRRKASWVR